MSSFGPGQIIAWRTELGTFVLDTHDPDRLIPISIVGTLNLRINDLSLYLSYPCRIQLHSEYWIQIILIWRLTKDRDLCINLCIHNTRISLLGTDMSVLCSCYLLLARGASREVFCKEVVEPADAGSTTLFCKKFPTFLWV